MRVTKKIAEAIRELEALGISGGTQTAAARDEVVRWLYDHHASMGRPAYIPETWGDAEIIEEIAHRVVMLATVLVDDEEALIRCDRVLAALEYGCTVNEFLRAEAEQVAECCSP